jgi:tryptophan-rich sensory protein
LLPERSHSLETEWNQINDRFNCIKYQGAGMIVRYASLAAFLLIVVTAAAISGQFSAGQWYQVLQKPDWTPPNWVFGPVWSVIYLLMALAAWKVWLTQQLMRAGALAWWLILLVLNVAWSWLFFELNRIGWSLLELSVLMAVAVMCIQSFRFLSIPAAWMLLPYLAWLGFLWVFNLAVWMMNGGGFDSIFG